MNKLLAASSCALLLIASPTHAASIYRCTDEAGNLTFTQQGCPPDHRTETREMSNPTPGSGKAIPLAKPRERSKKRETANQIIVVGERDDGCGNSMTKSKKRNAMIKQEVHPGMSRADIESVFGTPDSTTSRNGLMQYRYSMGKGRMRTISFDEFGCVRGKR